NSAVSDLLLHVYFDLEQPDKFQAELDRASKSAKPVQDLAVRFFVRRGQFGRAYDVKVRSERDDLERSILETELALKREPSATELIPQLVKNLVKTGRFEDVIDAG